LEDVKLSFMSDYANIAATPVDRALEPLRRFLRWTSVALLVVLITLPALQIVLRGAVRMPFVGAEELARFTMISVAFIAFPYVISSGANIRMEDGQTLLPPVVVRWLRFLIAVCGLLVFAFIAVSTVVATFANLQNATPTLGIPYYIFFAATFVGFALGAVECAIQGAKLAQGKPPYLKFDAERPPEELTEL
jgi:TRAP-type C4-dicarboxylate transport system permease small subunit